MDAPKIDKSIPKPATKSPPIRFRLRTFLIAITLFGVVIGLLGRTWNNNPELCIAILRFSPFFILAGQLLVAFRLTKTRSYFYLILIAGLLLFPAIQLARQSDLQLLPTRYLVEKRLLEDAEDNQVWRELERRLVNQKVSARDANLLVETQILRQPDDGQPATNSPNKAKPTIPALHRNSCVRKFLELAIERDLISEENVLAIGQQHYAAPTARKIRLRQGRGFVGLHFIDYGRNSFGCPLQLLWDVESAELDGKDVEIKHGGNFPLGRVEEDWKVGSHELVVHLNCAFVPDGAAGMLRNGVLDKEKWPKTTKRWKSKVTFPIQVYAEDAEIISLVGVDHGHPTDYIHIMEVNYWTSNNAAKSNRISASAKRNPSVTLPVSMCYDIFLLFGGQRLRVGTYLSYHDETGRLIAACNGTELKQSTHSLPKRGDLEFIPKPRCEILEQVTDVTEIWGQPFTISDCEIKPLLPPMQRQPPPAPVVDPGA